MTHLFFNKMFGVLKKHPKFRIYFSNIPNVSNVSRIMLFFKSFFRHNLYFTSAPTQISQFKQSIFTYNLDSSMTNVVNKTAYSLC